MVPERAVGIRSGRGGRADFEELGCDNPPRSGRSCFLQSGVGQPPPALNASFQGPRRLLRHGTAGACPRDPPPPPAEAPYPPPLLPARRHRLRKPTVPP